MDRRRDIVPKTPEEISAGLAAWEPHIHAFTAVDRKALTGTAGQGPLAGLAVGVKDIIDVEGLPTRNGSAACADALPARRDADVVASLRAAGARIVGKTTTTEFAFTDPTNCRNPHDPARSPGGSSSGSGAAVAAGLVDIALGTQTAGSLCRPAAYCGAVGFKPSFGTLSTEGVTPLAPSFDTVGLITRSVAVARAAFAALTPPGDPCTHGAVADIAVVPSISERDVSPSAAAAGALGEAADALLAMGAIAHPWPHGLDASATVADHRLVMNHEAATAHRSLLAGGKDGVLQPRFREGLRAGTATPASCIALARARLSAAKRAFWESLSGIDAIVTLPVPEGAPLIGETTGFQNWLTPWTVFGGPLLCLPWGLDRIGRPCSIMLAARPGQDLGLLAIAARLEAVAPDPVIPVPPVV